MSIQNCGDPEEKKVIIPKKRSDCTFTTIEEWDEEKHAQSCNTMFIMSDGSGAYIWNPIDNKWDFLEFASEEKFLTREEFEEYVDEQNKRLDSLEKLKPTQIRTTIGISGIPDSDIFNADVIDKADLLWTKQELPEGNIVTITGEFKVKNAQATSYGNIFWTTPIGFELFDTQVLQGQFISIVQHYPVTSASLNALAEVGNVKGWSNYGSLPAGYFTINVPLRAE